MDEDELLLFETPLIHILLSSEKSVWVNSIFQEREEHGKFHTLFPKLLEQQNKFFEYFRMQTDTFRYILSGIRPYIEKHSNFRKCISPEERLSVTLRFLSTGMAFRSLSFSYRIAHNTIAGLEMLEKSANDYENLWNFPNCVASIDGKHVRIKCQKKTGSKHYNYKGFFSVVLQALVDAHYKFLSVDVGAYGRQSDSGVFSESNLFQHMETGSFTFPQPRQIPGSTMTLPYVILGDQGYPLKKYLLRPYPTGTAERPRETEIYNYRLSRARRTVECAFGILVSKWRCLKAELQVEPHHVDKLVLTACLLHNILIDKEGLDEGVLQKIDSTNIVENARSTVTGPRCYNRAGRDAYYIRDQFKIFFNTLGATDFQDHQIVTLINPSLQSDGITNAIFDSNWIGAKLSMQKTIILFMAFTKHPLRIRLAGGLFDMNLPVFVSWHTISIADISSVLFLYVTTFNTQTVTTCIFLNVDKLHSIIHQLKSDVMQLKTKKHVLVAKQLKKSGDFVRRYFYATLSFVLLVQPVLKLVRKDKEPFYASYIPPALGHMGMLVFQEVMTAITGYAGCNYICLDINLMIGISIQIETLKDILRESHDIDILLECIKRHEQIVR
nr:unnamed protein product [Callosobruchus chinensis]